MPPDFFSSLEKDQGWHGFDLVGWNDMGILIEINVDDRIGVGDIAGKFFQLRLQNIACATPGGEKVD